MRKHHMAGQQLMFVKHICWCSNALKVTACSRLAEHANVYAGGKHYLQYADRLTLTLAYLQ